MEIQNNQQLTKKEQYELRKHNTNRQIKQTARKHNLKIILYWIMSAAALIGLIVWIIFALQGVEQKQAAEFFPSQGREHIQVGALHPAYNSNPPTSGWHYDAPAKAGFYEEPIADETLIHNIEHGHIVISYNCEKEIKGVSFNLIPKALAHEEILHSTTTIATGEETLTANFNSAECRQLKEKIAGIVKKYGAKKIVAVPRHANDALIALTAWTYLQKLDSFDEKTINNFIKKYRNRGPENTPE